MATRRIAGTAYFKANGVQFTLKGSLTISGAKVTRTGVAGADGVHGYKEEPRVPSISAKVTKNPQLNYLALQTITDTTITAEGADGTTWILSNAWQAGDLDLDTTEGEVTVKFEGLDCREMPPT